MDLNELLTKAVEQGASDLHVSVGVGPLVRIDGSLVALEGYEVLSPDAARELVTAELNEDQKADLEEKGEADLSMGVHGVGRFRVNVFRQRGTYAMVARVIPYNILSFEQLKLPAALTQFCNKTKGLVLVTGPTGSGKSTTLACVIDYINKNRRCHIVTLEDPIEYLHKHSKSVINQREIGADTKSFASGLRSALREDPDVILVGEMRDQETIATAIQAAETGHLVLATLHTNDCTQTVDRIIDVFPPHQQQQIRVQLSLALEGVASQQLLPRKDKRGRIVAVEVLVVNSAIRNLIREGKTHQIYSVIQTGGRLGMQTMDTALRNLVVEGLVTVDEALMRAGNTEEFKRLVRMK